MPGAPNGSEYRDGSGRGPGPGQGCGSGGGGSTKFCGGKPRHLQSQKHGGPIGHCGCISAHKLSWLFGTSFQNSSTTGCVVVVVVVVCTTSTVVTVVVVVVVVVSHSFNGGDALASARMRLSASSTAAWRSLRTVTALVI